MGSLGLFIGGGASSRAGARTACARGAARSYQGLAVPAMQLVRRPRAVVTVPGAMRGLLKLLVTHPAALQAAASTEPALRKDSIKTNEDFLVCVRRPTKQRARQARLRRPAAAAPPPPAMHLLAGRHHFRLGLLTCLF